MRCLRLQAVNQSVGRAIRHRGDYACMLLLDQRYATRRAATVGKLPKWIADRVTTLDSFGPAVKHMRVFFAEMAKHTAP